MSISTAQASALADNFLDDIGSGSVDDLKPRNTLTEFFLIAGELVEDAQNNLNQSNSNASGNLSESIEASEPQVNGTVLSVDISMNYYGQFINKGVRGTQSGGGLYAFKTPYPNQKMVTALLKGIASAKNKVTNTNRSKTTSRNERKNQSISDISKAWGAARNIKLYGIKPTGFLDKAIKTAQDKIEQRLGLALQVDVLNSLNF